MSKRTRNIIVVIGVLIIYFVISYYIYLKFSNKQELKETENVEVVPTKRDIITKDAAWCGTFQLVWNDMKNEVVKKDIVFDEGNPKIVDNLNLEEFTDSMISSDYYYKIYGLKSPELKEVIEKGILEKFNQKSDILDDFDWSNDALNDPNNAYERRYFFYTMLYRKFKFLKEFKLLDKSSFADKYDNIEYFGIDENSEDEVRNQIEVLFYNSKDDFAILLNTKSNDEVIYYKNPTGDNFNKIYTNMISKSKMFRGNTTFGETDEFKAPKMSFNIKREYTELEGKPFNTLDPKYDKAEIEKAIQTIKFSIDEKGGEIKSEAAIDVRNYATAYNPSTKEKRYFNVDDTFVLFLREKGKDTPYFAARVEDISKFI